MQNQITQAVTILRAGGIIAYPTEAVYGLGCDPFCEEAVLKLLRLKKRDISKGLILLTHSWQTIAHLVKPIAEERLAEILASYAKPITWVFPAQSDLAPTWLRGAHNSIAIRITTHPLAKALCQAFAMPIVSTSANIEGQLPARSISEIKKQFPEGIDYILEGALGSIAKPTPIYDAVTGAVLRS